MQHVSVSDGGQAIVGNVTQASRETAAEQVAKFSARRRMSQPRSPSHEGARRSMANHPRNTWPMRSSLRCGAKTRSGKPSMSPA